MNYKHITLLLTFLGCLLIQPTTAQEFDLQRRINPFPVTDDSSNPYDQIFFGGLNAPIQQFVDIDGDSDPDLFIQDRANQLIFFRNDGSATGHDYTWITDRFGNLDVGAWFKFADVDLDGDADLFAENPPVFISYYQNTGSATDPVFVLSTDTLRDIAGNDIVVDGLSVPEWADLYCASRQDLFLGRQNGSITEYRLTGFDTDNVPVYEHITDAFQDINIQTGGGLALNKSGERHGANSLTFVDIDDDGDRELFWGDFFAKSIIFIENTGSCTTPGFDNAGIVESYPGNDPLDTGGYNVPRFADIDGDSDMDMFVSVIGGFASFVEDRAANFYFYENRGTVQSPEFILQSNAFISSIDIGQRSIPALADIDDDGDLDLFLANQEDVNAPTQSNSRLYFFENTGSSLAPAFQLRNSHYLNFDRPIFGSSYAPVFADIDDDEDLDLFIGSWEGRIVFWRNDGSPAAADYTRVSAYYDSIDVGNNCTPAFADIDADGDLDLVIGEVSGNLNFYRNTGTRSAADFQLESEQYAGIDLGISQYAYPKLVDIDGDNDPDLLLGSEDRGTLLYRNIGTPQQAEFVADPSFVLPLHLHSSPNPADIDADGDLDLFLGVAGGGLVYYENRNISVGVAPHDPPHTTPAKITLLYNYPNPFNPETVITYEAMLPVGRIGGRHTLTIYNLSGQVIRRWTFPTLQRHIRQTLTWRGDNQRGIAQPSGVYFYQLRLPYGSRRTAKMLLTR